MSIHTLGSRAIPKVIDSSYEKLKGEILEWQSKLDAADNDPVRNFRLIRITSEDRPATISYNQHEILTGKPHRVVGFNQMPRRKYPIEIIPINVEWITATYEMFVPEFKSINIGPKPRF